MSEPNVVLTIENGKHIFYLDTGERLHFVAGTSIFQLEPDQWSNGLASFTAYFFVNINQSGVSCCVFDEEDNCLRTAAGTKINGAVQKLHYFDHELEGVHISGTCFLKYDTKHKLKIKQRP